jgi:hypothetical protein
MKLLVMTVVYLLAKFSDLFLEPNVNYPVQENLSLIFILGLMNPIQVFTSCCFAISLPMPPQAVSSVHASS